MPGAAGRALPRPGLQAQLREQVPARRARLAGRVPAADHDQAPPGPGRLVLQHRRKAPHPQSEMALARDRLRTMFFTARSSTTITSWSRTRAVEARCRKSARDARTFRRAGDLGPGLGAVRGTALAAGQALLVAGQGPFRRARLRGLGIFAPPEVTAKSLIPRSIPRQRPSRGTVPGQRPRWQRKRTSARTGPGKRSPWSGRGQSRSTSGHDHTNGSGALVFASHSAPLFMRKRCGCRSRTGGCTGFEPRVPGVPGEKRLERVVLVAEGLLQGDRRHLGQEREVWVFLHDGQRGVGRGVGRALPLGW